MLRLLLEVLHAAVALGLAHAFFGYARLTRWRASRRRPSPLPEVPPPAVAVVLAVRQSAASIGARLANLADSDHPRERLRLVVVVDGPDDDGSDATAAAVRSAAAALPVPVEVLVQPRRAGKPAALNRARHVVVEPVAVLADARQRFERGTIPALVRPFADPTTGAVSGSLEIAAGTGGSAAALARYWRGERALREAEAALDSCVGVTGAVCAVRRDLWPEIPADTLIDDVEWPMRVAAAGYRVRFAPEARAFDPQPLEPALEVRRKRRTLAGNFQLLARHPDWLLPGRHRLAAAFFWHKVARLLAPAGLAVLLLLGLVLSPGSPLYAAFVALQLACYALALVGLARPGLRSPIVAVPAAFLFLQVQVVRGLLDHLRGAHRVGWATGPATRSAP